MSEQSDKNKVATVAPRCLVVVLKMLVFSGIGKFFSIVNIALVLAHTNRPKSGWLFGRNQGGISADEFLCIVLLAKNRASEFLRLLRSALVWLVGVHL